MKKIITILLLMCGCHMSHAQLDIGVGAELGFPMLFNNYVKGHNHASGAPGARAVISYAPEEATFSGSIIAGISPMILPVERFNGGQDVLYMDFRNANVTLLGRVRKKMNNDAELLYGIGVGANFLKGYRVQISKRSDNDISRIIEDSSLYNKATLPALYLNVEYIRPMGQGSKFYYGIGFQLHYIYMMDQGNNYRVDIIDKNYQYFILQPQLTGQMINPMFFLNVYYRSGGTGR
ncbi:MAG: hypothetical protein H6550_12865 [Chitinophagales bacterium]|nr:hypothetical protein [Chitinophagales bacterium]